MNQKSNLSKRTFNFLELFEKFIRETKNGKRLKKNGTLIRKETAENYIYTLRLLHKFSTEKKFELVIPELKSVNKRDFSRVKSYWKNFYLQFTDYLYKEMHHYDNYVGQTIKNVRAFINWIKMEKGINCGEFHKNFYVRKEEVPIITLTKEQLQFLIFNKEFEKSLSRPLLRSKDIFVFGCVVGLRYSDIRNLTHNNLEEREGFTYLKTRSKKTGISTCIKLPPYLLEMLFKYRMRKKSLLPVVSLFRFNENVKKIARLAGWVYPVAKMRERKGIAINLVPPHAVRKPLYRFCDLVSSHTMRRTAITTMLSLGMPELLVKKISGHKDDSSAFYRYVEFAQQFMDKEIEKAHECLQAYA
jgi:integrase